MKKQVKEIPIYGSKLIFIDSTNTEKLRRHFPDMLNEDEEVYAHAISGGYKGDNSYFILVNSNHSSVKLTHGTIAHEAAHVVSDIITYVGIRFDHTNQEAFAYLIGYVVDEFYKWANKINIKIY